MNLPSTAARICHAHPDGYVAALPGIDRKTMVEGACSQLVEFKLAKGAVIPIHQHPQEQTGYLLSGHLILNLGGVDHSMRGGDAWCIPGRIEHGVRVIEDSVAIEIFSPAREDYRSSTGTSSPRMGTT